MDRGVAYNTRSTNTSCHLVSLKKSNSTRNVNLKYIELYIVHTPICIATIISKKRQLAI